MDGLKIAACSLLVFLLAERCAAQLDMSMVRNSLDGKRKLAQDLKTQVRD